MWLYTYMWSKYILTSSILRFYNKNVYDLLLTFFKKYTLISFKPIEKLLSGKKKDFLYVLLVKKYEIRWFMVGQCSTYYIYSKYNVLIIPNLTFDHYRYFPENCHNQRLDYLHFHPSYLIFHNIWNAEDAQYPPGTRTSAIR